MRRIVFAITAGFFCTICSPAFLAAQSAGTPDFTEIQPLLPPGISDFPLELSGRLAYTWELADGTHVTEVRGEFSARMGLYVLTSVDAVVWFSNHTWNDRKYIDVEIFLWQEAEVVQPGGTRESGPALIVTLRTFGRLILNAEGHAGAPNDDGSVFKEATRARKLLQIAPAPDAVKSKEPVAVAPTPERLLALSKQKEAKAVNFSVNETNGQLTSEQYNDQQVIVAINDVVVSQGSPAASGEYMEIRADAAVLFLRKDKIGEAIPGMIGGEGRKKKKRPTDSQPSEGPPRIKERGDNKTEGETMREFVSSVYLEGDVLMTRGERMIRAERLYYDFETEKALILDVVTRAVEPSRGLPIYVRADEFRKLSSDTYEGRKAQFTTSEFHTPHVAIGADKIVMQDRTPRDASGQVVGIQAGTYKAYHTSLNVEGLPIAYWPFSAGDFSADRQAFRSAKVGYSDDFGVTTETRWYLLNLMGLEAPPGMDATLMLDEFTDRGPAVGINSDYQQENYYGLVRSYYINDHGKDDLNRGPDIAPDHDNRGRVTVRHRQLLPRDWQLTLEGSYISDDQFLEEFERNEYENGKQQETLAQLLKRQDNWQYSLLTNYRINHFQTETEHLPDNMFSLIAEPLGPYATAYSESRAGVVRYRPDNRLYFDGNTIGESDGATGSVVRGDTREELQFPLPDLGPLKLTPYIMGRLSDYDDGPSSLQGEKSGNLGRAFGAYGVHGNMLMSKSDDSIESEFFDLHRLRHIIKPDFALWNAHTNRSPSDLTPFDPGVEDIDDFGGGMLGVRQRLQTRRGGPGKWRTVDWIVFDVEAGFFSDKETSVWVPTEVYDRRGSVYNSYNPAIKTNQSHGDYIMSRPEESISSNFVATNFQYRLSDSTVLVHDSVIDVNRGNLGTSNLSIAVERSPRMSYFAGWRYIHDTDNNLLAGGFNYKLSEKHTIGAREVYDIDLGRNYQTEFVYIRKWPRWYTAIALDVDKALDDVGVNFSIWPEGTPKLGLGSKRYTGLADSVGIRTE
jgi:hypothetical protein